MLSPTAEAAGDCIRNMKTKVGRTAYQEEEVEKNEVAASTAVPEGLGADTRRSSTVIGSQ